MSQPIMRSKGNLTLIFSFLPFFFLSCQTIFKSQHPPFNYYRSDFSCYAEGGWRNQELFNKYKKLWQEMRDQYQKENLAKKNAKVVIAGNSLVQLFTQELMNREFPGKDIVNRGIGGDMTETLLERLDEDILILKPETIIIEIGGNDLIQGKCLSYIENNFHKIIQKIRKSLPNSKIVFLSVPPTGVSNINSISPVLNQFIATLPQEYPKVVYLDTWKYMRHPNMPTLRDDFLRHKDRLHFNENGYSIWGKLLRPII